MAIPKDFQTALDMMPHLAIRAKERRTITYQELGELVNKPPRFLGQSLDVLRDRILKEHNLPRLDALVVNKETGEVGEAFYSDGTGNLSSEDYKQVLDDERSRVFAYNNWDSVVKNLRNHYLGAN